MKEYLKPDVEVIDFAALETLADAAGQVKPGVTSNPFSGPPDDDDRRR